MIKSVTVNGRSMYPTLHHGQKATFSTDLGKLSAGRCYLFYYRGVTYVHRLIWIHGDTHAFIGDNAEKVHVVTYREIVGVLLIHEKYIPRLLIRCLNSFFIKKDAIQPFINYFRIKVIFILKFIFGETS